MGKQLIVRMQGQFDALAQTTTDENVEYWFARDLQGALGYTEWRNFQKTIAKAKDSCNNVGVAVEDHFVDVNKMVEIGSAAERSIEDVMLTRYACYLIAQNGDPRKEPIAFAQNRWVPPIASITSVTKLKLSAVACLDLQGSGFARLRPVPSSGPITVGWVEKSANRKGPRLPPRVNLGH